MGRRGFLQAAGTESHPVSADVFLQIIGTADQANLGGAADVIRSGLDEFPVSFANAGETNLGYAAEVGLADLGEAAYPSVKTGHPDENFVAKSCDRIAETLKGTRARRARLQEGLEVLAKGAIHIAGVATEDVDRPGVKSCNERQTKRC